MQNKIIWIALVLCGLMACLGTLVYLNSKPPSIQEIRQDPTLFKINDYPDRIALHTRLSTLFPSGTYIKDIENFLAVSGIKKMDETYLECTHKIDYTRISFIYKFPQKTLDRVQVDGWPDYNEYCKPELTPVPVDEEPIKLPLMPLPSDNKVHDQ